MHTPIPLLALAATLAGPAAAAPSPTPPETPMHDCCPIVELRQYTLHPGRRDELITLFDNEFIESQEATGMRVAAQFRDANDAQRFVWIRGFASMGQRAAALGSFYSGPVWQAHRDAANATMADSDNVLLLRPAFAGSGLSLDPGRRPAKGSTAESTKLIVATIHYFDKDTPEADIQAFARAAGEIIGQAGARVLAQYVTEKSRNSFPRLPVRENENVLVTFSAFEPGVARAGLQTRLARTAIAPRLRQALVREAENLVLQPTARSLIR